MQTWDRTFIRSMTLRYIFALSVLALIAITADYVLQGKIRAEQDRDALVNAAGRLCVLSQRIAFHSLQLACSPSASAQRQWRQQLLEVTAEMETSFYGLLTADSTLHLPANRPSEARAIHLEPPYSLRGKIAAFFAASKALQQLPATQLNLESPHLQSIVSSASSELLYELDALVRKYQKESDAGVARLQRLERTVLVITIFVLLMMAVLIFRPMVKRIQIYLHERRQADEEREKLIDELRAALANVKTLSGLIPICASCKKIRDDRGYWNQLEAYLEKHSDADFTHGLCPECQNKFEVS